MTVTETRLCERCESRTAVVELRIQEWGTTHLCLSCARELRDDGLDLADEDEEPVEA